MHSYSSKTLFCLSILTRSYTSCKNKTNDLVYDESQWFCEASDVYCLTMVHPVACVFVSVIYCSGEGWHALINYPITATMLWNKERDRWKRSVEKKRADGGIGLEATGHSFLLRLNEKGAEDELQLCLWASVCVWSRDGTVIEGCPWKRSPQDAHLVSVRRKNWLSEMKAFVKLFYAPLTLTRRQTLS